MSAKESAFCNITVSWPFLPRTKGLFLECCVQVVDESNIGVVKSTGKGLCLTMQIKLPRKVS